MFTLEEITYTLEENTHTSACVHACVHVLAVISSVGAGLLIMLTGMFTIALIRTARVVIIVVKLMW